jgi:AcrR family transcriptional regulator
MTSARREREREETRRLITEAARKLFVSEGYAHVTMRRIAEAVEYTPGAIYSYFADKDAILHALHAQGFEELGRRMTAALDKLEDPAERLRAIGTAYRAFGRANPELYDLMFVAQAPTRAMDETWPEGARVYDLVRHEVRRGIEAGRLRAGDPEGLAFLLWGACHGMLSLELRGRTKVVPDPLRVPDAAYDELLGLLIIPDATPAKARSAAAPARPPVRRGRGGRRSPPEA